MYLWSSSMTNTSAIYEWECWIQTCDRGNINSTSRGDRHWNAAYSDRQPAPRSNWKIHSSRICIVWGNCLDPGWNMASTQNIIGNWKHTPTLYFTLYWTLGSQDDWRGPSPWTCCEVVEVPSLDETSSCHMSNAMHSFCQLISLQDMYYSDC